MQRSGAWGNMPGLKEDRYPEVGSQNRLHLGSLPEAVKSSKAFKFPVVSEPTSLLRESYFS